MPCQTHFLKIQKCKKGVSYGLCFVTKDCVVILRVIPKMITRGIVIPKKMITNDHLCMSLS